jgi:hypothetical protein
MKVTKALKALGGAAIVAAALLSSSSGALASGDAGQLGTAWTDLEVPTLGAALPDVGEVTPAEVTPAEVAPAEVAPAEPAAPAAEPTTLEAPVEPPPGGGDGVSWEESAPVAPEEPASAPEPTILEASVEPVSSSDDGVSWED